MPNHAYRDTHPHIRDEIVRRLANGETFKAICAGEGAPCYPTVLGWIRREPAFAARVAEARAAAETAWHLAREFDEAKAEAILTGLRAGRRIRDILKDPGMPKWKAYERWRMTQGHFQGEIWRLQQEMIAARSRRLARRPRPFDQAVADRIVAAVARGTQLKDLRRADPSLPSRRVVMRWRAETPDFDRAVKAALKVQRREASRASTCDPALLAAICDRLRMGASLRQLGDQPDMPPAGTLYSWVRKRPAFAAAVAAACEDREDWYLDQMIEAGSPAQAAAVRRARGQVQHRAGRRWRTE